MLAFSETKRVNVFTPKVSAFMELIGVLKGSKVRENESFCKLEIVDMSYLYYLSAGTVLLTERD